MKRQLVYVEFIDHSTADTWKASSTLDINKEIDQCVVHAVGWVIRENKTMLMLAAWHAPDSTEDIHMYYFIVKGAITKRKIIKVPK